jgi:hypothetical protein
LCIENCYPTHENLRFLRCCAIGGRQPGLIVGTDGRVLWRSDAERYCELWVSADEQLICFRPPGAPAGARVHRAGREVALEEGKPVVVMDGDHLLLPGLCYRLHVHGRAGVIAEPGYLDFEEPAASTLARFAAAGVLALGTLSAAACGKPPADEAKREQPAPPVEVRTTPPDAPPPMEPTSVKAPDVTPAAVPPDPVPPIEVRVEPPQVPRPVDPPPPPPEATDAMKPAPDAMKPVTGTMKPPIEVRVRPPSPPPPRLMGTDLVDE